MKTLVNLTNHLSKSNGKKDKTEMTGIRNKRETITTDPLEITKIIMKHYG